MKTLILYATKYGTTKEYAQLLSQKISGEVVLDNCKNESNIDLNQFDNVILGSSLYGGSIRKELSAFCNKNLPELKEKRIGLFVCGWQKNEEDDKQVVSSFPTDLVNVALSRQYFGGDVSLEKFNFAEKLIMKAVTKTDTNKKIICEANIDKMALIMNTLL